MFGWFEMFEMANDSGSGSFRLEIMISINSTKTRQSSDKVSPIQTTLIDKQLVRRISDRSDGGLRTFRGDIRVGGQIIELNSSVVM